MGAEPQPGMTGIDLKVLKKVLKFMEDAGLTELDIEMEGVKVRLRKGGEHAPSATMMPMMPMVQHAAPAPSAHPPALPPPAPVGPAAPPPAPVPAANVVQIKAPMVGTFYRAASPTSPPFVNAGDVIKEGQTICLIEAMKLMNEIKAEVAGKIVKILIENGQPVEFDQPMFELE